MRVVDVVQSAVKLFILEKRKQWAIIGWPSWCCGKIITTHTHTHVLSESCGLFVTAEMVRLSPLFRDSIPFSLSPLVGSRGVRNIL